MAQDEVSSRIEQMLLDALDKNLSAEEVERLENKIAAVQRLNKNNHK